MFGCHLNKKKEVKEAGADGEGRERERKGPMWKLRKWTKDGGYKTVVGATASSPLETDDQGRHLPETEERDVAKMEDISAPITAQKVHIIIVIS